MTLAIILWFRQDLRLHDHQPLLQSLAAAQTLAATWIPFYSWDPRQHGQTAFGFPKTGIWRAHFCRESLANLRQNLQQLGSDLLIRHGIPEVTLPALAQELGVSIHSIYAHATVTAEELAVEAGLRQALPTARLHLFSGHSLYHPEDLPFSLAKLPQVFTQFRHRVEATTQPRPPLPPPTALPPLPPIDPGSLPELPPKPDPDPRAVHTFLGGETAGLARLQHYIWEQDCLRHYKQTRNGMLRTNDSSKLSPWLAMGCLSPRWVYREVQRYEQERIRNDSTYWLTFELLWRDYFHFIAAQHGPKLFRASGLQGIPIPWQRDEERFQAWCQGRTGFPLVDANMQELAATGYMSNRGRQNVASFLTKNLGIDWRLGAEWFESLLIDYDVCSNWGNWNYSAGVGNDARGFRYFNIPKQSRDYDPQGDYLRHWLPALAGIPGDRIHEPYRLTAMEQKSFGVRLGVDYPRPIVDLDKSLRQQEHLYRQALAKIHSRDRE